MKKAIKTPRAPVVWSPIPKDTALADLLELVALQIIKQRRNRSASENPSALSQDLSVIATPEPTQGNSDG